MLRRLRSQGLDEEELHHFVPIQDATGKGSSSALRVRGKLAQQIWLECSRSSRKHGAWREPLVAAMERIEQARKAARERKLLQAVERAELLAAGATPEAAEDRAKAAADAMVQAAGRVREAEEQRVRIGAASPAAPTPVNVRQAVVAAEQNPFAFISNPRRTASGGFVNLFVGPHVRALLAAILLAACGLWVHQNALVPAAEVQAQATQAVESKDLAGLQQTATRDLNKPTRPLEINNVPREATIWVDGWNVGAAGMLLLASLFCRGNVMSVFAILGAAVVAVGHQYGIRTVEPFRAEHVALMLGSVIALVGFRAGR